MPVRQKITPFLWFDHQAEEAANLYVSLFADSQITGVTRYGAGGPAPAGSVMTVQFQLAGLPFIALNGGPFFQFTEAFSMSVDCETQAEIDELWEALCAGGTAGRCGWLKDRFGLSWQIIPKGLGSLLGNPDPAKSQRAMQAMLAMSKLDIETLQRAADGV